MSKSIKPDGQIPTGGGGIFDKLTFELGEEQPQRKIAETMNFYFHLQQEQDEMMQADKPEASPVQNTEEETNQSGLDRDMPIDYASIIEEEITTPEIEEEAPQVEHMDVEVDLERDQDGLVWSHGTWDEEEVKEGAEVNEETYEKAYNQLQGIIDEAAEELVDAENEIAEEINLEVDSPEDYEAEFEIAQEELEEEYYEEDVAIDEDELTAE